jgi:hypothetical protein
MTDILSLVLPRTTIGLGSSVSVGNVAILLIPTGQTDRG